MEDAEGSLEVVDWSPELGTRRSFAPAGPFPLSAKFDREFISEKPGERTKGQKTYCTVGIAQVKRELSIISERLVSIAFTDLRSRSIEIV